MGQEIADERIRKMAEMVNRPVVYSVPGMDQVAVRKDLVYTKSDDPNVRMDVYQPTGLKTGERRPAVLFVHGGAPTQFRPKEWGFFQSWGRLVAASGMVGVTFTYRQGFPQTVTLDSAADVAAAIAFVREQADPLGVDKERLAVAAYSSGGPMLSPYLHGAPPSIRCALGFYPFLDIRQSEAFQASGSGRFTPLFVTQGGKDEIPTLKDSVDRFVAEALVRGVPLTFLYHPDAPHAFDNQIDDDRTREIVKAAVEFLQWHLR